MLWRQSGAAHKDRRRVWTSLGHSSDTAYVVATCPLPKPPNGYISVILASRQPPTLTAARNVASTSRRPLI